MENYRIANRAEAVGLVKVVKVTSNKITYVLTGDRNSLYIAK